MLDKNRGVGDSDTTKVVPEVEIGHYSTGSTVTLWNTGGMAPGGTDGKDSFGRKVRARTTAEDRRGRFGQNIFKRTTALLPTCRSRRLYTAVQEG